MRTKSLILLSFILIACFWQLGGALLYMTALGDTAVAPWIFGLTKIVMVSLPFLAMTAGWKGGRLFKGASWMDIVLGLGMGTLFFITIFSVFQAFPDLLSKAFADARPRAETFGIATPAAFIIAGLFFSVIHSLFEEFYWRWFVFGAMQTFVRRNAAIVLSGFAFSLHHIVVLLAFTTPFLATLFGLAVGAVGSVWAYLTSRRGNIVAPWISHILADLAIVTIGYLLLFGRSEPSFLL